MGYKVILSPNKGFWSPKGWGASLSDAIKIPSDANVVLSFKDDDIFLIRRKDVTIISKHALVTLLVKTWISKNKKQSQEEKNLSSDILEKNMIKSLWDQNLPLAKISEMSHEILNKTVVKAGDEHFYLINLASPVKYETLSPPNTVTVL